MPRPKQTTMKTSRKERRKKFSKWIDNSFRRSQWIDGKITKRSFYSQNHSGKFTPLKKSRCVVCWEKIGSGWRKADNNWYCEKCTKYYGMGNREKRRLSLPQDKKKTDYSKWYQLKWIVKYYLKTFSKKIYNEPTKTKKTINKKM